MGRGALRPDRHPQSPRTGDDRGLHALHTACASFGIQEQYDHGPRPDLDDVLIRRPGVEGGRAVPAEIPGLGVDIDREAARALTARALERPHLRRPDGSFTNW